MFVCYSTRQTQIWGSIISGATFFYHTLRYSSLHLALSYSCRNIFSNPLIIYIHSAFVFRSYLFKMPLLSIYYHINLNLVYSISLYDWWLGMYAENTAFPHIPMILFGYVSFLFFNTKNEVLRMDCIILIS